MQSPLLNDSHNSGNSKVDTILHLNSLVYYNLHFCFHSTDQANHTNEHAADERGEDQYLPALLFKQPEENLYFRPSQLHKRAVYS